MAGKRPVSAESRFGFATFSENGRTGGLPDRGAAKPACQAPRTAPASAAAKVAEMSCAAGLSTRRFCNASTLSLGCRARHQTFQLLVAAVWAGGRVAGTDQQFDSFV